MLDSGWVKIDRKMLSWRWFSTPNTAHLFLYMILAASIETSDWKDITVPRGSFVSSIRKLSTETGLTEKQVRVALEHLKKTGEVAQSIHSKFSVFTVVKYDQYQSAGQAEGKQGASNRQAKGEQGASNRQAEGNQGATVKEYKELKNIQEEEEYFIHACADSSEKTVHQKSKTSKPKVEKIHYAEFVSMTEEERQKLVDDFGEAFTAKCIEVLDNYKGSSGKKYKDDYRTILNWVVGECEKRYPNLKKQAPSVSDDENPFASYPW